MNWGAHVLLFIVGLDQSSELRKLLSQVDENDVNLVMNLAAKATSGQSVGPETIALKSPDAMQSSFHQDNVSENTKARVSQLKEQFSQKYDNIYNAIDQTGTYNPLEAARKLNEEQQLLQQTKGITRGTSFHDHRRKVSPWKLNPDELMKRLDGTTNSSTDGDIKSDKPDDVITVTSTSSSPEKSNKKPWYSFMKSSKRKSVAKTDESVGTVDAQHADGNHLSPPQAPSSAIAVPEILISSSKSSPRLIKKESLTASSPSSRSDHSARQSESGNFSMKSPSNDLVLEDQRLIEKYGKNSKKSESLTPSTRTNMRKLKDKLKARMGRSPSIDSIGEDGTSDDDRQSRDHSTADENFGSPSKLHSVNSSAVMLPVGKHKKHSSMSQAFEARREELGKRLENLLAMRAGHRSSASLKIDAARSSSYARFKFQKNSKYFETLCRKNPPRQDRNAVNMRWKPTVTYDPIFMLDSAILYVKKSKDTHLNTIENMKMEEREWGERMNYQADPWTESSHELERKKAQFRQLLSGLSQSLTNETQELLQKAEDSQFQIAIQIQQLTQDLTEISNFINQELQPDFNQLKTTADELLKNRSTFVNDLSDWGYAALALVLRIFASWLSVVVVVWRKVQSIAGVAEINNNGPQMNADQTERRSGKFGSQFFDSQDGISGAPRTRRSSAVFSDPNDIKRNPSMFSDSQASVRPRATMHRKFRSVELLRDHDFMNPNPEFKPDEDKKDMS